MHFLKLFYKIKRNRKYLLITLAALILVLIAVPLIYLKSTNTYNRSQLLQSNPAIAKLLPLYWQVRKLRDIAYLPYYFKKNPLPTYQLTIKDDDLKKLSDSLPQGFSNVTLTSRLYVPAEFTFDSKTYDVEVRYRGDNAIHWNAPKKSYLIKFTKDDPFNGYRQLSLIIPNDRYFALEHLNNYRAGKLGLYYPPSWFANLKLNGHKHGLYFVIENWNDEMLAKWQVPDQSNFYGNDSPENSGIAREGTLWDSLDYWQLLVKDEYFNYDHFTELSLLLDMLNQSDDQEFYDSIFNLIDADNFYHWQVLHELSNANHHLTGSMRLYFDNSSGKFYFIPWDVGGGSDYAGRDHLDLYGALAARIFSNSLYLHQKNKLLYDYAADPENLEDDLNFYDTTYSEIKTALYKDRLKIYTNHSADSIHEDFRGRMIDHFDKIHNDFSSHLITSTISVTDDDTQRLGPQYLLASLDISIQSMADLYLVDIDPEFIDGHSLNSYRLYYDANSNGQLDFSDTLIDGYKDIILFSRRILDDASSYKYHPELTSHLFFLTSSQMTSTQFSGKLKSIKLDMQNAITGDDLKNKDISITLVNQSLFKHFDLISDIDKFISLNPIFNVNKSARQITLPAGSYSLNRTVIIPREYNLTIQPGTTFFLGPGVSLVSYSPITALGLPSSPISFLAQNANQPWGVVAVINSPALSRFSHARFFDGQDDYINGVFYSGMLSVYHSPATISFSEFRYANGDDALNVKSATAELSSSTFIDNSADAVDFDFISDGFISGNSFYTNGNDAIDLSGSTILIQDNYITGSGDKCISLGEQSLNTLIYNNALTNCDVGVEIKDASTPTLINNVIVNNRIGLNAYVKKPIFGGGQGSVYNSIIWHNQIDIQTDEFSKIDVYSSDIDYLSGINNNFSLEPHFRNAPAGDFTILPKDDNLSFINGGDSTVLNEFLDIQLDQAPVGLNN